MTQRKHPIIAAGILASALLAASPFALADHHGDDKHNPEAMCAQFQEGKGRFDHDKHQARIDARWAEMAERLELTDEQMATWNQIQQEQRERHEQRRAKWQKKLEQRCNAVKQ